MMTSIQFNCSNVKVIYLYETPFIRQYHKETLQSVQQNKSHKKIQYNKINNHGLIRLEIALGVGWGI